MTSQQSTAPGLATLTGTPVVPGVAYASVMWPGARPEVPPPVDLPEDDRDAEAARFSSAAQAVADRLRTRAAQAQGAAAEVLGANAGLASDKAWIGTTEKLIRAGTPAANAVAAATDQFADMFTKLGGLMAERVTDLRDVRDRVVAELLGGPEPGVPVPDAPSILLADDLAPADTAGLDPALIVGIGTRLGGPTSHTAIIARQLGIPCIVGLAGAGTVDAGTPVLLDGGAGTVTVDPEESEARMRVAESAREAAEVARWRGPGHTSDGAAVAVLANVQDGATARGAAERQVEGVGLFRTELAFLDRADEPSVEEQAALYREVIDAFPGQKVVIRTLDAGSDKPLKFVDHGEEENPALGVRGIRIAEGDPGLLDRQLDAIAAAAEGAAAQPWVMAPMIATAAEARDFAAKCRARGLTAGVMVEVPAVALCADAVLAEVDFASLGTNDLTQYAMAADRMSTELAALTDPWQPAVLRLIQLTARAGIAADKPVGVCGEAAADPLLACVLVGLGVTSLSCAAGAAAAVGARVGSVTLQQCRWAAEAAVAAPDPQAAREAARAALSGNLSVPGARPETSRVQRAPGIGRGADMIDHFGINCADLDAAKRFYDGVLAVLGSRRLMDFDVAVGYGAEQPVFWISGAAEGASNREAHIAFAAPDTATVDEFHRVALELGAESLHAPRLWPEYHPGYYGAFVRDADGNNVEAVFHGAA